jgi:peptidyl-prolyl cis-trans isomerase C
MSTLRYLLLPVLLAAALVAGCGDKNVADDSKVLAKVNDESITEKDYEVYLQLRSSQQGPIPDKEKEKDIVLNEMIDRALLAQKGEELGLDKNPEVHFRLKRVRENLLAQEVIRHSLKDAAISDDELKQRFAEEVEKTHKTEYKLRHILVKTEDEAKDVLKQEKAGKKFAALAKERSLDPGSKDTGGQLGDWISQGSGLVPEFFNAVTALKKGETSEPVKTEFGWHVIKVDDTRPLKLPTVDEFMSDPRAPQNLRRRMQEEKLQDLLKQLRGAAKIVNS